MKDFDYYLDELGEIGFVEEIIHSIAYVSGLPGAHPSETVVFETGELGEIVSLDRDKVEVLLLTSEHVKVGEKVARTGGLLQIPVGDELLGRSVDPLIRPIDGKGAVKGGQSKPIDTQPHGIVGREEITEPLETGVTLVDLAVPLGKGQRELVIGDRKTGKTEFLLQTHLSQASQGTVCIYAVIGQRQIDIKKRAKFLEENDAMEKSIIVATGSSEPAGLIYLTPYTAMTIAEYFRDKGFDVLLILDDMTTHARYYREISLLARRFPGRSSYPGDIFYIHAKLVERAGNFRGGSITCLPVAESVMGDLSGYIQTNLMSMTDGHIFFDIDLYNQGKRPAVNPHLSVTRVGHQAQTPLERDLSRELSSFLIKYEKMKEFLHFGAEAGENVRGVIDLGKRVDVFFNQSTDTVIPININILILGGLWAGIWNEVELDRVAAQMEQVALSYQTEDDYKKKVDDLVASVDKFSDLVEKLRRGGEIVSGKF